VHVGLEASGLTAFASSSPAASLFPSSAFCTSSFYLAIVRHDSLNILHALVVSAFTIFICLRSLV